MERFTISIDKQLAMEFDELIRAKGYRNRSEAVRDILRTQLEAHRLKSALAPHCIANLSYIYNHHERALAERLTALQHAHHDLCVSTLHAHLDHDNCIESVILRGPTGAVRRFADAISAERGVRHGQLNLVPVDAETHGHGKYFHLHTRPKT